MANKNVFNRNVSQLDSIPRSLQRLEHRHTFDAGYGMIIPNFSEILYPNETLRLRTTNFLRSIPMKTPQLSRVRIFQRYVAVPLRILWQPWEDYINSMNPVEQIPTEPYICNFNTVKNSTCRIEDGSIVTGSIGETSSLSALASILPYSGGPAWSDVSTVSLGPDITSSASVVYRSRGLTSTYNGSGSISRRPALAGDSRGSSMLAGYQFFPHELGDYLNAPLYSMSISSQDVTSRFSAFKFGAYQLAYNFFYRRPNVEERVDDYYEMFHDYGDSYFPEYKPFYAIYRRNPDTSSPEIVPLFSRYLDVQASNPSISRSALFSYQSKVAFGGFSGDYSTSTDSTAVALTSWRNCEKFILRSGANMNLQAKVLDADGDVTYHDSYISLTRMRYAPWMLDRFTSANPWPQRGSEAQIGVSGLGHVVLRSDPNNTHLVVTPPISAGYHEHGISIDNATGNVISLYSELIVRPGELYVSPANFRFAMQLQHAKEKSGMTDGRYKSYMSMFFGSRLHSNQIDYPQFIGGFVQDLNVNEVEQTSESASTPLGTLAGRGVSARKGSSISFHATEHTVILGLFHIMPDAEYIGGLNREEPNQKD